MDTLAAAFLMLAILWLTYIIVRVIAITVTSWWQERYRWQ
jgi:hypothetical protein